MLSNTKLLLVKRNQLNQDNWTKAWNFASEVHKGQVYGDQPYILHLAMVATEVLAASAREPIKNLDLAVLCAILHDTIEDQNVTTRELKKLFGKEVSDGVKALSKNPQLPKSEKMEDSLKRIKLQPKDVWCVKLADRIVNLQPPPKHWNKTKIQEYKKESQIILNKLGSANSFFKKRLFQKIKNYQKFC